MTGWKCPVCGAGVAPHVTRCDHGSDGQMQGVRVSPIPPHGGTSAPSAFGYKCRNCGGTVIGPHTCWTVTSEPTVATSTWHPGLVCPTVEQVLLGASSTRCVTTG